eukprot:TRINITY_DN16644_c0_g10_i1.p1 TRINITY_DN16644_c0_g10~~TRINITY_DN16644_c0_g10_i1.p1  ORF type:complete len:656 (+),score=110.55 TRINITY_DN16644_c0_g10_i1:120-2087(+)
MGCSNSNAAQSKQIERLTAECEALRKQVGASATLHQNSFAAGDATILNSIFEQFWPHISVVTAAALAEEIEPAVRLVLSSLPAPFNTCTIDRRRSHLGKKPVKFYDSNASWEEEHSPLMLSNSSNLMITTRLDWDGDASFFLVFTGATLGIKQIRVSGDFCMELVGLPDASAWEETKGIPLISGVRAFFANQPSIFFEVEREKLAYAVNTKVIEKKLQNTISDKLGRKLVFPNCQGIALSPRVDILDVRRPVAQGVIFVEVMDISGVPEGQFTVETTYGPDVFGCSCTMKDGSATLSGDSRLTFLVWSAKYQRVLIKLFSEVPCRCYGAMSISVADLLQRSFSSSDVVLTQADGLDEDAEINLRVVWHPIMGVPSTMQNKTLGQGIVVVGIYSATHVPYVSEDAVFWVEISCPQEMTAVGSRPLHKTSNKRPVECADRNVEAALLARKIGILRHYAVSNADVADVLEVDASTLDSAKNGLAGARQIDWNEAFEYVVQQPADQARLSFTLWQRAPSEGDKMLGTISDLAVVGDCNSGAHSLELGTTGIVLKVRMQLTLFGTAADLAKVESIRRSQRSFRDIIVEGEAGGVADAVTGVLADAASGISGAAHGLSAATVGAFGFAAASLMQSPFSNEDPAVAAREKRKRARDAAKGKE